MCLLGIGNGTRYRGMKSPANNISVVNLELRMHNFIARMQRAENKMSRDVSGMGPGGPSKKGNQSGGARVRAGAHEGTEEQRGPDGPVPGKFSDAGCPPGATEKLFASKPGKRVEGKIFGC